MAPEGLLLLTVAVLHWNDGLPAALVALLSPRVILGVFSAGALLAWRLRRSRIVFAFAILALAHPVLTGTWPGPDGSVAAPVAAALLLPPNLLALGLLTDRGVFSRAGLYHTSAIAAQAVLLIVAIESEPAWLISWLERDLLPARLVAAAPAVSPVLPSFVSSGLALAALGTAGVFRPDPTRRGLLWATAALLLATHGPATGTAIFLLTAGLVLVISVIESSFSLAYRDGLTGLPSRRALNEELRRLGSRYAIAMVDVDRFKGINDRYGHDVGDQVLRRIAAELARVPGRGRAYRYGGEEFTVIFAGRRLEEIVPHLERVRRTIEDLEFIVRAPDRPRRRPRRPKSSGGTRKRLSITVSIGAAERTDRLAEPEQVIREADRALYRAKDAGRNRVIA